MLGSGGQLIGRDATVRRIDAAVAQAAAQQRAEAAAQTQAQAQAQAQTGGSGAAATQFAGARASATASAPSTQSGLSTYDKVSMGIHTALSAGGAFPVLGIFPDAVDFVYTLGEVPFGKSTWGDVGLAGVGIAATLAPVAGDGPAAALKVTNRVARLADDANDLRRTADAAAAPSTGKHLLPGEGNVGTYDELKGAGSKGDDSTPHHVPSKAHMEQHGVAKGDGISMNMEHPCPGVGDGIGPLSQTLLKLM